MSFKALVSKRPFKGLPKDSAGLRRMFKALLKASQRPFEGLPQNFEGLPSYFEGNSKHFKGLSNAL